MHVIDNILLFRRDLNYSLRNVYKSYYSDLTELNLGVDFTFVNDEMISMTLGGTFLPEFEYEAHFKTDVNYKDKLFLNLNAMLIGKMEADGDYDPVAATYTPRSIPAHLGISLGAEYKYNRAISFFAKFDNIAFQRYYLWLNYPAPRFNAMLGITYTIPNQ